ncbi:MAG: Rap1a/Tai family immunity protein, partial [Azovibrio sp.]|nr:Rap1a/Tai family immunity protein [Azovibrio sp.]
PYNTLGIRRSSMTPSQTFISALAFIAALTMPSISQAAFWDGYKLKELADADDRTDIGNVQPADYQKVGYLIGFVVGVHDAVDGILVCTPNQVKVGQIVSMVKKYVRENPDKWNRAASTLVMNALSSAFPCKK